MANEGRVVQIIGPVVDVEFPTGKLPTILNAVHITDEEGLSTEKIDIITEVPSISARIACGASR